MMYIVASFKLSCEGCNVVKQSAPKNRNSEFPTAKVQAISRLLSILEIPEACGTEFCAIRILIHVYT
jgi:hypothetical protein